MYSLVDNSVKKAIYRTVKNFTPRLKAPSIEQLRTVIGDPWKAQMAHAWLRMCDESLLQESMDWLNGKRENSELKKVLNNPLSSRQDELEMMTRDRDFDIDVDWRKQPWMKNYPTKRNLTK